MSAGLTSESSDQTGHGGTGSTSTGKKGSPADWASALRLQQWTKNLLLFVPLIIAHRAGDLSAWGPVVFGVLAIGLVASATYLLNDLNDLDFDRLHLTKRFRAIAAGHIGVTQAATVAAAFLVIGFATALILSWAFAGLIVVYLGLTLAYAVRLKREPLMDVAVIGALYALRLAMGATLIGLAPSAWMLGFGVLFFFSLAVAKRHNEVMCGRLGHDHKIAKRGYRDEDWPLTLAFGVASGVASLVVLVVAIATALQIGAIPASYFSLVAPACLALWLMRVWLVSHRMEMHDDALVFACKDWVSWALAAVAFVGFVAAG
jgi:4-hydroxybenzoate polyprenyltransferase